MNFSVLQEGDWAYSILYGWGRICYYDYYDTYPIHIRFQSITKQFDLNGYSDKAAEFPELTNYQLKEKEIQYNCFDCFYAKWENHRRGECTFPLPSAIKRYPIVVGVFSGFSLGGGYIDFSKVGYETEDGSIMEIINCPCWSSR